jgi:DNA-binding HxlR family transcriptional regulator
MTKRQYDDGCGTAHALELVGERWALLIVRELLLGPKRFTDLRAGLPAISPNVLTQRLDDLEQSSILVRRKTPPPNSVAVYELTPWGMELEDIVKSIGRWAARSPNMPEGAPMSVNSVVLSFRTMFSAEAAKGFNAKIAMRLADQSFIATVANGEIRIVRGEAQNPDAALEADPNALVGVVYGGQSLNQTIKAGAIKLTGDQKVIARFAKLFPLPPKAPDLRQTGS